MKCKKSRKANLVCEYPSTGTSDAKGEPVPLVRNRYSRIVPRTKEPSPECALYSLQSLARHTDAIPAKSPTGLVEPVLALFYNQTDSQYFTFFLTKTSRNLSGCFNDDIWNLLILQSCHEEESTRHAVVAIAALHKTASNSQAKNEHHTYALQKYAKALKLMRESVSDVASIKTNEHQLRRALVSTLLITCFESFHGNQSASISQASTAIRLLHSRDSIMASSGNSTINQDILSIFARLELSSLTITQREIVPQENTPKGLSDDHILSSIPAIFETLREARFYWDILARRSQSWRASYGFAVHNPSPGTTSQPPRFLTTEHGPDFAAFMGMYNNSVEAAIRTPVAPHRLKRLEEQLSSFWRSFCQWSAAFASLFTRIRAGDKKDIEYYGVTVLMISMLASGVNSAVKNPKTEDAFSAHMLTLIKEIIAWEKARRDPEEAEETIFLFDVGILAHLFIAATRSHDRFIRREAVEILKSCRRREGVIDSAFCHKVCAWLQEMDYEEDRKTGEVGRRKARLVVEYEMFDFEGRKYKMRCKRIDTEGVGLVYTPVMTFTW